MKRISTDVIGTVGEEMPWLTRRCSSMGLVPTALPGSQFFAFLLDVSFAVVRAL